MLPLLLIFRLIGTIRLKNVSSLLSDNWVATLVNCPRSGKFWLTLYYRQVYTGNLWFRFRSFSGSFSFCTTSAYCNERNTVWGHRDFFPYIYFTLPQYVDTYRSSIRVYQWLTCISILPISNTKLTLSSLQGNRLTKLLKFAIIKRYRKTGLLYKIINE